MSRSKLPPEVVEQFETFWKDIVCDKNGRLSKELVMRELYDYGLMLDSVSKVYYHITDGMISKPNTTHTAVISVAEEKEQERLSEALEIEKVIWEDELFSEPVFHVSLEPFGWSSFRAVTVQVPLCIGVAQEITVAYDEVLDTFYSLDRIPEEWRADVVDAVKKMVSHK